jgi:hypothetical protein
LGLVIGLPATAFQKTERTNTFDDDGGISFSALGTIYFGHQPYFNGYLSFALRDFRKNFLTASFIGGDSGVQGHHTFAAQVPGSVHAEKYRCLRLEWHRICSSHHQGGTS